MEEMPRIKEEPQSPEIKLEQADTPSTSSATPEQKFRITVQPAAQQLKDIFKKFRPLEGKTGLNRIHQLTMATYALKTPVDHKMKIEETIDFNEIGNYWMRVLCEVARWMQYMDEFTRLPFQDKIKILRNSWGNIHRLLSVSDTLDLFGEEALNEYILVVGKKAVSAKTSQFSKEVSTQAYIQNNFVKSTINLLETLARPMFDMDTTNFELAFLLGMTLWNFKGLSVSEEAQLAAERFRAGLAEEMHTYYVNVETHCYAPRMIRLMELVQDNELLQRERGEMWALLELFDMLNMEIDDHSLIDPRRI
ncbi:unnamed protein product, partial [Mesorhabditis spiculigera]